MEVCLINLNKGQDDEGCLEFCNILKWSAPGTPAFSTTKTGRPDIAEI
jgi:hypothetical protein